MLNRFVIVTLLLTTAAAMAFKSTENQAITFTASESGNTLTVTNPSLGTAVMSWSFAQPSLVYNYVIEDVAHHQVVKSGQTSQTGYTATGLSAGSYRFTVGNGSEYVIVIDVID